MLNWLFGKRPVSCWAIKQIDRQVLHLCPRGRIDSDMPRDDLLRALRDGRFSGGVRLGYGDEVLDARLFAAVVPETDLQQDEDGVALWRGRRWMVARVPDHSWAWPGRLVASYAPREAGPQLVSHADISRIQPRDGRASPPPGEFVFRVRERRKDPTRTLGEAIEERQDHREAFPHREHEVG